MYVYYQYPQCALIYSMMVVDEIYEIITDCQQLYPDSELSSDSAEAANEYFTTADGLQHLSLEGESVLNHLENILVQNQNQLSMEDG